jgi:NAD(P)-dependent dehydrogenase (short-subunit alcohol dehydrogenase family)
MRALVTGAGRGIGANIARKLAAEGWEVVVCARSRQQVEAVADEFGGRAVALDVTDREGVEHAVANAEPLDLLVANAGTAEQGGSTLEADPRDWWRVFEVNVLGVHLCCRAVIPGMLARRSGRIVITGSGAAYLPPGGVVENTAYPASKAAVCRYGETLAAELAGGIPVFFFSPGLVQTELTSWIPDDAPWTPPELAPQLVFKLASGRYDALAGRYLHAEHDDLDDLLARIDDINAGDLNAIRLRR